MSEKERVGAVGTAGECKTKTKMKNEGKERKPVMAPFIDPCFVKRTTTNKAPTLSNSKNIFLLLAYVEHRPGDVVWLPPCVLQKSHKVQLVNAPNKPRLDLHSPFLILDLFSILHVFVIAFPASMHSPITRGIVGLPLIFAPELFASLSLENCSKALVPVKHINHPTRFQIAPE